MEFEKYTNKHNGVLTDPVTFYEIAILKLSFKGVRVGATSEARTSPLFGWNSFKLNEVKTKSSEHVFI